MKENGKNVGSFHLYTDTEIEIMHVSPEERYIIAMQMAEWIDVETEKEFEEEERRKDEMNKRK